MDGADFHNVNFINNDYACAGKSVEGIPPRLVSKVPEAWRAFNQLFFNQHCMDWFEIVETLEQLIAGTFDFDDLRRRL